MYKKEFWKKIEKERNEGTTVMEVCQKYSISTRTLRRARLKGLLNDTIRTTPAEAKQKRDEIRKINPKKILQIYINNNKSVSTTMQVLKLSNSKANKKLVKEILDSENAVFRSKKRFTAGKYDKQTFIEACERATNFTELTHLLNLSVHTTNNRHFKKLIKEYDINCSHWYTKNKKYDYTEIFCEKSKIPRTVLRKHVLFFDVIDLINCSECGINEWNGQILLIQIDHINGNSRDNRIENLRGLCPNCHSLTKTFCGKKRIIR